MNPSQTQQTQQTQQAIQHADNLRRALQLALTDLRKANPFLFAVAMQLRISTTPEKACYINTSGHIHLYEGVIDPNCATTGGEPWNIRTITPAVRVFILAHEIVHFMLLHTIMLKDEASNALFWSLREQDPERMRKAIEYQCNSMVYDILGYGLTQVAQPKDADKPVCYDWPANFDPKGLHWKQIWDKLTPSSQQQNTASLPAIGITFDVVDDPDDSSDDSSDGDTSDCDGTGSSATVTTTGVLTPAHIQAIIRRAASTVGSLPASLTHTLDAKDAAVLPWKALLKRVSSSVTKPQPSWRRYSKKSSAESPRKGEALVVEKAHLLFYVDTSGSVEETDVKKLLNAFVGLKTVQVSFIYFDTATYGQPRLVDAALLRAPLTIEGRGGTDHQCVSDHWQANHRHYDQAVVVTDGEMALPPTKPRRMSWVFSPQHNAEFRRWAARQGFTME